MKKECNLVEVVEMWVDGKIDTEEMKRLYNEIPQFKPEKTSYFEDIDPIMYSDGSGNSLLEVEVQLVNLKKKMTLDEYYDWLNIVEDSQ